MSARSSVGVPCAPVPISVCLFIFFEQVCISAHGEDEKKCIPRPQFPFVCYCPSAKLSSTAWLNWFTAFLHCGLNHITCNYCKSHTRLEHRNTGVHRNVQILVHLFHHKIACSFSSNVSKKQQLHQLKCLLSLIFSGVFCTVLPLLDLPCHPPHLKLSLSGTQALFFGCFVTK